jgi:hypothetical protein
MLVHMLSVDALTYWRVLPLYLVIAGLAVREHGRYDRSGSGASGPTRSANEIA